MKPSVFITGATGFLGREFLKRLDPTQFNSIFCLVRDPNTKLLATLPENIVKVVGDLDDPSSYQACLNEVQYVVHMAAVTGKVSPKKYHQNIVEGTRALVQLCVEAKVERFIYISSIAAKFEKLNRYYYGIAKKAAEEIVTNSGLNYLILRPTMIMGDGSPVFEGLFKLALAPIIPVFGNGKIQVQPIDVTDAAALVSSYLMRKDIANHVIELGGPEVMTIDGFLIQIKRGYLKDSHAKTRVFHIPMVLTLAGLTPLELLF